MVKIAWSNVKIKENEVVYNGKRKIFHAHKENWLTKQLVEKNSQRS